MIRREYASGFASQQPRFVRADVGVAVIAGAGVEVVRIADKDHVFFEYTAKETSAFVLEMFQGYLGYVQADAKSVYDVLFREPYKPPTPSTLTDGLPHPPARDGSVRAAVSPVAGAPPRA